MLSQCQLQGFNLFTCHFLSSSPFFVYFGFLSLQVSSDLSTLTQGSKGLHLFRLTCSVVLWGGRNTANKYCWRVLGVIAVCGPHWLWYRSRQHVFPVSTLLRLQVALQRHRPKQTLRFMPLPDLSCSGSRALHKGTDSAGCALFALPRSKQLRGTGVWLAHLQVGCTS